MVDGTEDKDSGEVDLGVRGAAGWRGLSLRESSLKGLSIHMAEL